MRFLFQALQQDGRLVSGQIEAGAARDAYRDLRRRGLQPTTLAPAGLRARGGGKFRRKARARDYTYLLKELHALLAGGVPLAEAVAALEEAAEHPAVAAACAELHAALRRGEKFTRAFARCFARFPAYIHRIVEAGELSGRLAEAIADAAAEMEHAARVRGELRNALVYPAFLVGAGVLAVLFIFIVVVPRFAVMFHGHYASLPWLSYAVIGGGMWLREHLAAAALVLAGGVGAGVWAARQADVRARAVEWLGSVPMARDWLIEVETARWAAVLARLLENRVPLMQSLELARTALASRDIQLRLGQVERAVRTGGTLAHALDEHRFLPSTALSLVRVGERSGTLPVMMRNVASIYDETVRNRLKGALTIIEPVAIVIIGGVIGLVAVAIFLAITAVNNLPQM
ncbi:MAG TPA: type II secretion system F family protein [Stellaceae bacterium]|nr:type II secretion system F family protein [Stellaceae bacterium]